MSPCLFAYGSLLTADASDHIQSVLSNYCRLLGNGCIQGRLYMLDGYPGAVPSLSSKDRIFGTVYRLLNVREVLRVLDEYEAYALDNPSGSEYIRARTSVVMMHPQKRIPAWVYWYNGEITTRPRISSGNYIEYRT